MAITYTITTNFGAKDSLPTGDSGKIIKGAEFTTEFNAIQSAFALAAPVASPTFTGTATIPTAAITTLNLGGVAVTATAAELNYVDGVTSNVQTQLDAKAPLASPTFTGVASFNGAIKEKVYALTGTVIDPDNGTIQYKTLSGNTTFTETLSEGEYVILMIDDGTSYTVTWPSTTWVGGSEPTLETSGYNIIALWKVGSTLYGVTSGAA